MMGDPEGGEHLLLREKIKHDEFNRDAEEQYRRKFRTEISHSSHAGDTSKETMQEVTSHTKLDIAPDIGNVTVPQEGRLKKGVLYNLVNPMMDLGKHFYASLTLIYEPKLYHLSILLSMLWAYKNVKCINKVLFYKYNDIHYQIVRPDSLNSRSRAFKILAIGGSILPCSFISLTIYDINKGEKKSLFVHTVEKSLSQRSATTHIPYTLRRDISRKVRCLKEKMLFFARDLAKNNRLKRLSEEYHRSIDKRLQRYFPTRDQLD
ncbi:conserved Plasmodium protein, unknown function [Plasmodium ovale]|uniref:Uncharacterized protein n=1 Tax=Plasmodium ovale TaxID=36330 RepID=A0A1C3KHP9_PLAOA|nr:conserved Plasmodium protein, unknown function [Plasmodium ovale]